MDLKKLRKRCEERLRAIDLPVPFDARAFCDLLATRRGRPIVLCPVAIRGAPSGAWMGGPSTDFIFYARDTSRLHQEHIILHEVSHLLCGHRPTRVTDGEWSQVLFAYLPPGTVQEVLYRAAYSAEEEREAELLASLILERTASTLPPGTPPQDPATARLLRRLEVSLEGHGERER